MEVLLKEEAWARHLADQTLAGLRDWPPHTPPVWFYDAVGSDLFDQITRLPEYYPTKAERAILTSHGDDIAAMSAATTLVELGAGSADKTRTLLAAMARRNALHRFVPVDCSRAALAIAADQVSQEFEGLPVHCIVADFNTHLPDLPSDPCRMVAFLGSTIGNLQTSERQRFLADVAGHLGPKDTFLLGTDLVKPVEQLIAAYNDRAGVTGLFNLNALTVMNRQLGSDFDLDAYTHEAAWVPEDSRIEMRLVARSQQRVSFAGLQGHQITLGPGQWLRTEISVKFTSAQVRHELTAAGMTIIDQWTDPDAQFLVSLAAVEH